MINPDKVKKIAALGAALFLASDASSYITGHTILLEGGGLAQNSKWRAE